jgi:nitroreductase
MIDKILDKIKLKSYYDIKEEDLKTEKDFKKILKDYEILKKNFNEKIIHYFKSRRSIRKYSDKKVPFDIIYNIIDAALNAPAAGNVQNYDVILVSNENEKKEIGKIAFQQYWISDASYILIITRDDERLVQLYPSEGEVYSVQNTAAFIENILLMAHFYDLGACWVEAYDNEVLKEYLGIPIEKRVDAIIPIGYPEENPKVEKLKIDSILYFNKFGNRERE